MSSVTPEFLIMTIMAKILEAGSGSITVSDFERCVILPVLHNKHLSGTSDPDHIWDWWVSYVYLSEARAKEVFEDGDLLNDDDYRNNQGDVLYFPYGVVRKGSKFIKMTSLLQELARKGGVNRIMTHRQRYAEDGTPIFQELKRYQKCKKHGS